MGGESSAKIASHSPRLRGAIVSGEDLRWRSGRAARLLALALTIGAAGVVAAGCGGDSDTDSVSSEAQERIERGAEEAKKGVEQAEEEAQKGIEKGREEAERGIEEAEKQAERYGY
jgi:hypothetical protein